MTKPMNRKAGRSGSLLAAVLAVPLAGIAMPAAFGDDLYWDINGADPGAGGAMPSGIWGWDGDADFSFWSTDPAGEVATGPWVDGSVAVFSAGDDATGNYTISLAETAVVWASGFRLENGNVTINHVNPATGSGMELGTFGAGPAVIDIAPGHNLTLGVAAVGFDAWHLTGGGTWTLRANKNIQGDRIIDAGSTVSFDNALRFGPLADASGSITLRDGAQLLSDNPGQAGAFIWSAIGLRIGEGGGTVGYDSSGDGTVTIYGGLISRDPDMDPGELAVLTKTGRHEFRVLTAQTADYDFDRLVVNEGLYRIGSITGMSERGFGAEPATPTPDAIVLDNQAAPGDGLASIGVSSTLASHANRGITIGPGGGAIAGLGLFTVNGDITGPGKLYLSAWNPVQGTELTGNNTHEGGTQVSYGILFITGEEQLGSGPLTIGGEQMVTTAQGGHLLGTPGEGHLIVRQNMSIPDRDVTLEGLGGAIQGGTGALPADVTVGGVSSAGNQNLRKVNTPGTLTANHVRIGGDVNIQGGTLRIAPNGTNAGTSKINGLTINLETNGTLDLTNNMMAIQTAEVNDIVDLIVTGRDDGIGIVTSTANRVVGVAPAGALGLSSFGGLSVDADDVLLRGTFPGDATLDGVVNISDLSILAGNWQQTGRGWWQGDFNYDGVVNISDLSLLAGNWQAGASGGGMSFEQAMAMFDVFDGVVVPEPAALGLLGFGALGLLGRRRRP